MTTRVDTGFEAVTFDLGSPTYTFASNESLVVRLIASGPAAAHIGFDADPTPSRLETTLS